MKHWGLGIIFLGTLLMALNMSCGSDPAPVASGSGTPRDAIETTFQKCPLKSKNLTNKRRFI